MGIKGSVGFPKPTQDQRIGNQYDPLQKNQKPTE